MASTPTPDSSASPGSSAASASSLDGERAELLAALTAARSALVASVRGLDDEQAARRPTVSALCLGGLVKHVTATETGWLDFVTEGPSAMSFALPDGVTWDDLMAGTARELPQWAIDREQEFRMLPGETVSGILHDYEQAAARTEKIVAAVPDLSAAHPLPDAPWNEPGAAWSVRRVLVHLVAETAQHAGHADILRESIDGRQST
ncbi:DinB family protein [Streptomyces sp. NPDC049916]|uniref:DinB family protein n=1 Tax=Streptomyces sp. NPDC049916 TaxID=3155156 RepID=UPI0034230C0A